MKKTYIKPQLDVVATNAGELLNQTSWAVYAQDDNKYNHGSIIYDEGEGNYGNDEYDPWTDSNW